MDPSRSGVPDAAAGADATPERAPSHRGFARLARDSVLFTLGGVAGKAIAVLIVPIVARLLEPADFGRLDILSALLTAVTSVAVLGFDVASTRLYPDLSPADRRHMFASWGALDVALTVVTVAILGGGSAALSDALFGTTAYASGFVFVSIAIAGNLFQVLGLTVLRNQDRPSAYALISSATFLIGGALTIVFVVARPTANAAMAAVACGMVVGGAAAVVAARRVILARPSASAFRGLTRLGLPLVPALVATWFGEFVNRTVLLGAAGASEVGYFSVAARFGSVGVLLVTGFQLAWHPQAFALGQHDEALRAIAKDSRRIMVASTMVIVPIGLLAPELVRLLGGSAYLPAVPAVGLLLVQSIAFGLYVVATMGSAIAHRMRDLGLSATIGAVLAVLVNIPLARAAGSGGTAGAMAFGQLVAVALAAYLSRRASNLRVPWVRVLVVSLGGSAIICAATLPPDVPLLVRAALGLVFLGVVWLDGGLGELVTFARSRVGRSVTRDR